MFTSENRPIQYPLDRSLSIEETITDTSELIETISGIFPEDSDERVDIVLNLSLNEYVALATSVDVGRDIAYGEQEINIWYIWCRAIMSELCAAVLDCINETTEIQDAISQYAQSGSVTPTTPENASILASELVNNPPDCDNDIIFGMCKQLVEFVDSISEDILQQIVAANVAGKALAFLISAIPVVESLPLDEAAEFGSWLAETIYDSYLAASTVTLRDEVSCDLFCLAVNNDCVLSMQDARDYFLDQLGITLDLSNPLNFLNDLIAENLVGNAAFYGMFAMVFQMFSFGEIILGNRFETFLRIVNTFFNDPDSDWSTLCDCVETWEHTFDFTEDDGGFVAVNGGGNFGSVYGTWNASGWSTEDKQWSTGPTTYRRGVVIQRTFTETYISEMDVLWDFTEGSSPTNITMLVFSGRLSTTVVGSNLVYTRDTVPSASNLTDTLSIEGNCDNVFLLLTPSQQTTASYSGAAKILSVTLRGEGTNPFI